MLLRNNGDGTFADVTVERGLGGLKTVGVTASDLNNDRAIDLVFTGPTVSILINPREGAYKTLDAFTPGGPANTRGVVAFDFDKDGWMDLAFTHFEAPVSLWRNVEGKAFEPVTLPTLGALQRLRADGHRLRQRRVDRSGGRRIRKRAADMPLQVLRNVEGRFEDVSERVGVGPAGRGQRPARTGRGRSRRRQRRRSAAHQPGHRDRWCFATTAATPTTPCASRCWA